MKLLNSILLCYAAFLIQVWQAEGICEYLDKYSGRISYTARNQNIRNYNKCWYIDPPQESIVHLKIVDVKINDGQCDNFYIELSDNIGRYEKICQPRGVTKPFSDWSNNGTLSMMGAVNITLAVRYAWNYLTIIIDYHSESVICFSKDHFRCSPYQCIRSKQKCDGVTDCDNGLDESECGIMGIEGTNASRINAINWLMKHHTDFGWGRNTHRAVTALYLTDAANFRGHNTDEEIIVRQLQLKTAASLLRNLTEPMTVNELSMYVNALLVTCHNVRNIFSEDLLEILANRAFSQSPPSPGAYLTLCNANWPFSEWNVNQLINILSKDIEYPFGMDIKAMAIMALSCLDKKTSFVHGKLNASSIYNETLEYFTKNLRPDGSLGNVYTTATVMQALISSGEIENGLLNVEPVMEFLMENLNSSSVDFLTVYLSLPLFKGKSLADIGSVDCSDNQRKLEEDEDILDVMDKLGAKIHIRYSLYIGDNKNVIHDIYLKVPENSTAYDVIKVAQRADPKYKFSYYEMNTGHVYVYEVAGLTNDMESGKFWLSYIASNNSSELKHFTESPDQVTMRDKDHLIMWYKSANI